MIGMKICFNFNYEILKSKQMEISEIATKEDINKSVALLSKKIDELTVLISRKSNTDEDTYIRTKGIKEMLKVSDNKLKTMRENGEIPFSFIGSTYYYPKKEILKILEANTIKKKV